MVKADGDRFFYSTNDLYSVYALTDGAGNVVERYMYDPYGKVTVLDGNGTPRTVNESLYGNPWTFTGRRLDQETGLMYYRNRMYETGLGRFCGRDPIGYRGGIDLYAYVNSRPTYYIDPYGLDDIREWPDDSGIVGWMPEPYWGWDDVENFRRLGTLDKNTNVVTFDPAYGFGDMPWDELEEGPYGSYDWLHKVKRAIKKKQKEIEAKEASGDLSGYRNGFSVADYYPDRVTKADCDSLGPEAAMYECMTRIQKRQAYNLRMRYRKGMQDAVIGVFVDLIGGLMATCLPGYWKLAAVPVLAYGVYSTVTGFVEMGDSIQSRKIAQEAVKKYCCCCPVNMNEWWKGGGTTP